MKLCEKILRFYSELALDNGVLPDGITAMNPYQGEKREIVQKVMFQFYSKFYNDNNPRKLILGINPGRHGAGVTGLMFTDTLRLQQSCGIELNEFSSRELSSEFLYKVIERYGGAEKFYGDYYISAISPLGFIINKQGNEINYNYYDSRELQTKLMPFIKDSLHRQMSFNIQRKVCFCLGTGKNFTFLSVLNNELKLFKSIIPLEHPRFIMQYKRKKVDEYIEMYLEKLLKS
jgi:hypothetical protein